MLARASFAIGDVRAARPLLEDLLQNYLGREDMLNAVRVADDLESALVAIGETRETQASSATFVFASIDPRVKRRGADGPRGRGVPQEDRRSEHKRPST